MPEADKKNLTESAAKPGRKGKTVFLAIPALLLVVVGIWFWTHRGTEAVADAGEPAKIRSTLHLETFVLNLSDPDQRSYLRVGIDLGLDQEAKHGEESVPVAEVRDTILGVLAQGKVDELLTADGKTKLKASLLAALQQRLPQLGVAEVYFTEFLIQR